MKQIVEFWKKNILEFFFGMFELGLISIRYEFKAKKGFCSEKFIFKLLTLCLTEKMNDENKTWMLKIIVECWK